MFLIFFWKLLVESSTAVSWSHGVIRLRLTGTFLNGFYGKRSCWPPVRASLACSFFASNCAKLGLLHHGRAQERCFIWPNITAKSTVVGYLPWERRKWQQFTSNLGQQTPKSFYCLHFWRLWTKTAALRGQRAPQSRQLLVYCSVCAFGVARKHRNLTRTSSTSGQRCRNFALLKLSVRRTKSCLRSQQRWNIQLG